MLILSCVIHINLKNGQYIYETLLFLLHNPLPFGESSIGKCLQMTTYQLKIVIFPQCVLFVKKLVGNDMRLFVSYPLSFKIWSWLKNIINHAIKFTSLTSIMNICNKGWSPHSYFSCHSALQELQDI